MSMLCDGTLLVIEQDKFNKEKEVESSGEQYQLTQYDTKGNQIFRRKLTDVAPFFMIEVTMEEKRCLAMSFP